MTLSPGKNIRIFKSDFLEKFTYVHPIVPLAFWGPVVLYNVLIGPLQHELSPLTALAWFAGGALLWTPSEYLLHRWIFHFHPKGPFQERLAFLIHGIHHDDPQDQRRLLMPPVAAVLIAAFFYGLFFVLFGPLNTRPFFAGFISGYLVYDYTHFAVHFSNFKSGFFKKLKRNHMLHHFSVPGQRFGVSSTFWDRVFKTSG